MVGNILEISCWAFLILYVVLLKHWGLLLCHTNPFRLTHTEVACALRWLQVKKNQETTDGTSSWRIGRNQGISDSHVRQIFVWGSFVPYLLPAPKKPNLNKITQWTIEKATLEKDLSVLRSISCAGSPWRATGAAQDPPFQTKTPWSSK